MKTSPIDLIAEAERHGVILVLGGDSRVRARPSLGQLPAPLISELKENRDALRELLAVRLAWHEAVAEIATLWDRTGRAVWLDDIELVDRVDAGMKSGRVRTTREAIDRWRGAWRRALAE